MLVSLSRIAFPPVLFMSRRLRHFIAHVQYLIDTLLCYPRRGKLQ